MVCKTIYILVGVCTASVSESSLCPQEPALEAGMASFASPQLTPLSTTARDLYDMDTPQVCRVLRDGAVRM